MFLGLSGKSELSVAASCSKVGSALSVRWLIKLAMLNVFQSSGWSCRRREYRYGGKLYRMACSEQYICWFAILKCWKSNILHRGVTIWTLPLQTDVISVLHILLVLILLPHTQNISVFFSYSLCSSIIFSPEILVPQRWPHKCKRSWHRYSGWSSWRDNPFYPSVCLFLTCSSPDVAFHAPPWRSACGPVPVAPSRNRRKPKEKGLNLSGKSHCYSHLINRKSCLEMRRGEKGKKKIVLPTNDSKFGGILPSTVLLIYYEGIIVELSWPIWHKGERRGLIHYSHCNIFRAVRDMCLNRPEPGLTLQP